MSLFFLSVMLAGRTPVDAFIPVQQLMFDQPAPQCGDIVVEIQQDVIDLHLGVLTLRFKRFNDLLQDDHPLFKLSRDLGQAAMLEEGPQNLLPISVLRDPVVQLGLRKMHQVPNRFFQQFGLEVKCLVVLVTL